MSRSCVLFLLLLPLLGLVACGSSGSGGEGVFQFSFVIVADPHIYGSAEADARLQDCVDWVNQYREAAGIELVFVVGDLGGELARAKGILDGFSVPWIPLIGDNCVQGHQEEDFETIIGPQHTALAPVLAGWTKAPTPVPNPDVGRDCHLQNFSFDHKGVHFVCLDWCARVFGGMAGEQADLHAFPGGTWPWFQNDVVVCDKSQGENIVMMSHHAMHNFPLVDYAFSAAEEDMITTFTAPYGDHVYADFAGHYHINWHEGVNAGGYEVFVTDATWDDEDTLRIVRVSNNGERFIYDHELVTLGDWE